MVVSTTFAAVIELSRTSYISWTGNISIEKAKSIIKHLNSSTKTVALTVNATDQFLRNIVTNLSPDYIQLHGKESPYRCFEIKKYKFVTDKIIIDSPKDHLPGGNGKTFNWKILKKGKKKINWLLAGGINLSNVSKAIKITKTKGLDISSGVEISKGCLLYTSDAADE